MYYSTLDIAKYAHYVQDIRTRQTSRLRDDHTRPTIGRSIKPMVQYTTSVQRNVGRIMKPVVE